METQKIEDVYSFFPPLKGTRKRYRSWGRCLLELHQHQWWWWWHGHFFHSARSVLLYAASRTHINAYNSTVRRAPLSSSHRWDMEVQSHGATSLGAHSCWAKQPVWNVWPQKRQKHSVPFFSYFPQENAGLAPRMICGSQKKAWQEGAWDAITECARNTDALVTLEQLWWMLGEIVKIRVLPGYLWQINASQEFAGGMPRDSSPDRTFINNLDAIEPMEWAGAAGVRGGAEQSQPRQPGSLNICNEMKRSGLNGNCKVQSGEDLGKESVITNLGFKEPQTRNELQMGGDCQDFWSWLQPQWKGSGVHGRCS